jgi:hypothetical protein
VGRAHQNHGVPPAAETPDARALRFEQAVVAIVLLVGFVFGWPLLVPAVGVVLAAPVVIGPQANVLRRAYDTVLAGRVGVDRTGEPPETTHLTRVVEVVLLSIATVFVALDVPVLVWLFGLSVVAITAVAATTGVNLVAVVSDRRR